MKLLFLFVMSFPAVAQINRIWNSTTDRITSGSGAPASANCNTQGQVGKVYINNDTSAGADKFYHCRNNGGSIGWAQASVSGATAAQVQSGALVYCGDAGASDTYTCGTTPALAAYTTGMMVILKPNTANTGAATVNIDSLGAKTIVTSAGAALSDGVLAAGSFYAIYYDGTNFRMGQDTGTGGATAFSDLTTFKCVRTSATVATCGTGTHMWGNTPYVFSDACVITLAASSVSADASNVRVYIASDGTRTVGLDGNFTAANVSQTGTCSEATSITAFPGNSQPLWTLKAGTTNDNWDTENTFVDHRSMTSREKCTSSPSGLITGTPSADGTCVPEFVSSLPLDLSAAAGNIVSVGTGGYLDFVATNNTGTGTTVNLLAKLAASNTVTVSTTSDTTGALGVCVSGCGASGSSRIAYSGNVLLVADNTVAANDWIIHGTSTGGRGRSAGGTKPTSGQVIGRARTGASAGSTFTVLLDLSDASGGSALTARDNIRNNSGNLDFDPNDPTTLVEREDFIGGGLTGSTPNGVGKLGWSTATSSGTPTYSYIAGTANHPGVFQMATAASSGNDAYLILNSASAVNLLPPMNTGEWEVQWVFKLSRSTSFFLQIGMVDNTSDPNQNSLTLRVTDGTGNFLYRSCASSSCTDVDSGVALDTNWHRFRMRRTGGTIDACLDACSSPSTVSSTIPTVALVPAYALLLNQTTGSINAQIDYWSMKMRGLTRF